MKFSLFCIGRAVIGIFPTFKRRPVDHPIAWLIILCNCLQFFHPYGVLGAYPMFLNSMKNDSTLVGGDNIALLTLAGTLSVALCRVIGIFGGRLADSFGSQILLLLAAIACPLALLFASICHHVISLLFVFTLFMGLCLGLTVTPTVVSTASWTNRYRSVGIGLTGAAVGIGQSVLPLMSAALLAYSNEDWRFSFQVLSSLAAISIVASFFAPVREDEALPTPFFAPKVYSRRKLFCNRYFWFFAIECLLLGFSGFATSFIIVPYAKAQGTYPYREVAKNSAQSAAILMAIYGVTQVLQQLTLGFFSFRIGYHKTHIGLTFVSGSLFMIWAALPSIPYYGLCIIMAIMGYFRTFLAGTLITDAYYGHHAGEVVSVLYVFVGIGGAIGPPICAAMTESFRGDYSPALYLIGAVTYGAAFFTLFLPSAKVDIYDDNDPFATFGSYHNSPTLPGAVPSMESLPGDEEVGPPTLNVQPPSFADSDGGGRNREPPGAPHSSFNVASVTEGAGSESVLSGESAPQPSVSNNEPISSADAAAATATHAHGGRRRASASFSGVPDEVVMRASFRYHHFYP
jgi:MFS family permease